MVAGDTSNRRATSRRAWPASTAAMIRSRRSTEYARTPHLPPLPHVPPMPSYPAHTPLQSAVSYNFDQPGRNTYPDFTMVHYTEGYEIKGLAYPGRWKNYDA